MNHSKFGRLIKKAAAVILSMVMVFGAVSVMPEVAVHSSAASVYNEEMTVNGCSFSFSIIEKDLEAGYVIINNAEVLNSEGKVEIPSTIEYGEEEYPVTKIASNFMENNTEVRTVIVPDSVIEIGSAFLLRSSVEKVTISKNVETISNRFCASCSELKPENVIYNGTKLEKLDSEAFDNSPKMINEDGNIIMGKWLIKYTTEPNVTSIKVADLGNNGTKIERIASGAFANRMYEDTYKDVTTLDLEGIKYIGNSNFNSWTGLTEIINADDLEAAGSSTFTGTPWYDAVKETGLVKLGGVLYYYKTNSTILDFSNEKLAGVKSTQRGAFKECKNIDTIKCTSDSKLNSDSFYSPYTSSSSGLSPLPDTPAYNIKTIYLDGKKLEFSAKDPLMPEWFINNYEVLSKTQWFKDNVEAKTKVLFEQLDMPYYGLDNHMEGRLSPTEEFYDMLKVHEFMSTFEYNIKTNKPIQNLMYYGTAQCATYASMSSYMLQCAGVTRINMRSLKEGNHAWNQIKIGDEWFECDMGWDEQNGAHDYYWFGISSSLILKRAEEAESAAHVRLASTELWYDHALSDAPGFTYVPAARTIGDLNGNDVRDDKDAEILWDYVKGNIDIKHIDAKAADINFDGIIDITDAVLLENFLHGTAVDPNNFPRDALSPGFNIVYVDVYDPKELDPNYFTYGFTDRDGYVVLPESEFTPPDGMKFGGWDYGKKGKVGKVGERVKISNPYTVIKPIWKDEAEPDDDSSMLDDSSGPDEDSKTDDSKGDNSSKGDDSSKTDSSKPDTSKGKWLTGDVDGNNTIDISDVSKLINHINGVKALNEEELLRADVNKSGTVDISDASTIVNHINGVKAIEGMV